ncbi:MAG: serine hydrolase domain-containing protein [Chloroflexota bacterium]|nr:serine hydrolase domain-containing protein [Chloroflexota bacterium]
MFDFTSLDILLQKAAATICPAIQLVVRWRGREICTRAYGWLDPETHSAPTTLTSRFDLASLTKLFTVTALMCLVEDGALTLEQPLSTVLPAFRGRRPIKPYEDPLHPGQLLTVAPEPGVVDVSTITFCQLLTHTSGLPAWRPLYLQPTAEAARGLALQTFCSYHPGTHVVYSDIGLILLGMALERLTGLALDTLIQQRVLAPLGLAHTGYSPSPEIRAEIAPTEFCRWRGRRVRGVVHDENAYRLGGVSAHAGLFSTATDVAIFGQSFLAAPPPLLRPETIATMITLQAQEGPVRRGLGFALWQGAEDLAAGYVFGHTGFTGTLLWIDPERELVISLLTNEVYQGRQDRKIAALRKAVREMISRGVG